MIEKFNIRVYGLLEHKNKLLVLEEPFSGTQIFKFPGGGLEFGEGLVDCLKREFKEELNLEITKTEHVYTQEDFVESRFRTNEQLILIYYKVEVANIQSLKKLDQNIQQILWLDLNKDLIELLQLPLDKIVVREMIH